MPNGIIRGSERDWMKTAKEEMVDEKIQQKKRAKLIE